MNTRLMIALLIPWFFWGALMGLLAYAKRSWINLLIFPLATTLVLGIAAVFTPTGEVFWASIILHAALLIWMLQSYLRFVLNERKKNRL